VSLPSANALMAVDRGCHSTNKFLTTKNAKTTKIRKFIILNFVLSCALLRKLGLGLHYWPTYDENQPTAAP
jgi:hypothetical protein